jgi:hypothetical protein
VKKDVCAYKEQYPSASQQNIAHCFSLLWGIPTTHRCVGDMSEKENSFDLLPPPRLRKYWCCTMRGAITEFDYI